MFNTKYFVTCRFLLVLSFVFFNQIKAKAQIVIGTPSLGFTQACASDSFNTYSLSFVFSPESALESSNQFPFLEGLLKFPIKHHIDYNNRQQPYNGEPDHLGAHQIGQILTGSSQPLRSI